MKKILFTLLATLCFGIAAEAGPAWPGVISYTQPDGSVVKIRQHGDEFFHWVTDESGQVVEMDEDGFYRPASAGQLSASRAAGNMRRAAANAVRRRGPGLLL